MTATATATGAEVSRTRPHPERRWRSVQTDPPPSGERVECYARGWASVPQGVVSPVTGERTVWFGSWLTHLTPDVWRGLPPVPDLGDGT